MLLKHCQSGWNKYSNRTMLAHLIYLLSFFLLITSITIATIQVASFKHSIANQPIILLSIPLPRHLSPTNPIIVVDLNLYPIAIPLFTSIKHPNLPFLHLKHLNPIIIIA